MSRVLLGRLAGLWVGEARSHGALTIFPLTGGRQGELDYVLLQDAVEAGQLEVRELPSANVEQLLAVNKGKQAVLILDGEELVGGKQNRTINSTVLLPIGETVLPVSCVEQGRWHDVAPHFSASETSYPSLRASRTEQVNRSLQERGTHESDQGAVWESISLRQKAAAVSSGTGAMADIYGGKRDAISQYERTLTYPDGAVGLVTAIGGSITALEVFDSPRTARRLWGRLVRAAAVDALTVPPNLAVVELSRAIRMLGRARHAKFEWFRTPGLGEDVRVTGGGVVGAALLRDGAVIHTALFRKL